MKFVSRNANLGVVLKKGVQGHPQLGTETISGVHARFKDGVLSTDDESLQQLLLKHPAFKLDYFLVEEGGDDPYANTRAQSEPAHIISDMKNGHPERVTKVPANITPELRASLMEIAKEMSKPMAMELAKQMLPSMVMETLKAMSEQKVEHTGAIVGMGGGTGLSTPKKAGRPKKVATE